MVARDQIDTNGGIRTDGSIGDRLSGDVAREIILVAVTPSPIIDRFDPAAVWPIGIRNGGCGDSWGGVGIADLGQPSVTIIGIGGNFTPGSPTFLHRSIGPISIEHTGGGPTSGEWRIGLPEEKPCGRMIVPGGHLAASESLCVSRSLSHKGGRWGYCESTRRGRLCLERHHPGEAALIIKRIGDGILRGAPAPHLSAIRIIGGMVGLPIWCGAGPD
jgi:hypothetical protein